MVSAMKTSILLVNYVSHRDRARLGGSVSACDGYGCSMKGHGACGCFECTDGGLDSLTVLEPDDDTGITATTSAGAMTCTDERSALGHVGPIVTSAHIRDSSRLSRSHGGSHAPEKVRRRARHEYLAVGGGRRRAGAVGAELHALRARHAQLDPLVDAPKEGLGR